VGSTGHGSVPHTADVRIEAWAPTRERCVAEAVAGMVDTFADVSGIAPTGTADLRVERESDEDLLVAVLDEVIYLLDTRDLLPVATEVTAVGVGLAVRFATAGIEGVPVVGAVPKAVSLHELRLERRSGGWWCAVTLDV
jgi:SHS2 domain-containing protein